MTNKGSMKEPLKRIAGRRLVSHKVHVIHVMRDYKRYHGMNKALRWALHYHRKLLSTKLLDNTKEHIVGTNGYRLKTVPNDIGISTELLAFKTHEPITTRLLLDELGDGMFCIDIGSNIGYYPVLESRMVGSKGKVVCFEPSPRNFAYLTQNTSLNGLSNVETYNMAVGGANGYANFVIREHTNLCRILDDQDGDDDGGGGDSDGSRIPFVDENETITRVRVPMKTLDTFMGDNKIPNVDLIRMDVEGYEYRVYDGMINTVRRFRPALLLEVHQDLMGTDKTVGFLNKLQDDGYEIKWYVSRSVDYSLIGNMKDVDRQITIDKITKRVRSELLYPSFHLYLVPSRSLAE